MEWTFLGLKESLAFLYNCLPYDASFFHPLLRNFFSFHGRTPEKFGPIFCLKVDPQRFALLSFHRLDNSLLDAPGFWVFLLFLSCICKTTVGVRGFGFSLCHSTEFCLLARTRK